MWKDMRTGDKLLFKHLRRKERHCGSKTYGLIRQYFPKGTDFGDITQKQVLLVLNILNSRPRKRLGYMTFNEKFKQLTNLDYNAVALYA